MLRCSAVPISAAPSEGLVQASARVDSMAWAPVALVDLAIEGLVSASVSSAVSASAVVALAAGGASEGSAGVLVGAGRGGGGGGVSAGRSPGIYGTRIGTTRSGSGSATIRTMFRTITDTAPASMALVQITQISGPHRR